MSMVSIVILAGRQTMAGGEVLMPPFAKVIPHQLTHLGPTRVDHYYWLNQRDNPEVISYLEAENEYLEESMHHTEGLQQRLFEEITGRIKKDDSSVPYLDDGYYYYDRYEEVQEYPYHCRKGGTLEAAEQVMPDVNELPLQNQE